MAEVNSDSDPQRSRPLLGFSVFFVVSERFAVCLRFLGFLKVVEGFVVRYVTV